MQGAARRLLGIVEDLIDYSRTEAGTLAIDVVDFDLPRLLRRVVDEHAASASARGLALELALDSTAPARLRGDPLRLAQLLGIGLSNGVKFSSAGTVVLRVTTCAIAGEAATLRFSVEDTGGGLPDGVTDRLFQAFSPGDSSPTRVHGGIGLELALARRLVGLMGGEIGLDDRPGKGSTYWFELRLARAPDTAAATADPLAMTAAVAYLDALLADTDYRALAVWRDVEDLLSPLFGAALPSMREALEACDFALARTQLASAARRLPPVPGG